MSSWPQKKHAALLLGLLTFWSVWFWLSPAQHRCITRPALQSLETSSQAGAWLSRAFKGDGAFKKEHLRAAWKTADSQPGFPKLVMGVGWLSLKGPLGRWRAVTLPLFLLGLAALALAAALGARAAGPWAGLTSASLLASSPGFVHTLHTPGPEAVIAFSWLAFALCLTKSSASGAWRWRGASFFCFGLVAASHYSGAVLWLGALIGVWWASREADVAPPPTEGVRPRADGLIRGIRLPIDVLALPLAGAGALVATWPRLLLDPRAALERFYLEPLKLAHPSIAHGGQLYSSAAGESPPALTGLMIFLERLPLALLLGLVLGTLFVLLRGVIRDDARARPLAIPASLLGAGLLLLCFNGSPFQDHLRLDVPLTALAAVLAGPGLVLSTPRLRRLLSRILPGNPGKGVPRAARVGAAGIIALLVLSATLELVSIVPYERFYRNLTAGPAWDTKNDGDSLETEPVLLESWMADLGETLGGPSARGRISLAFLPEEKAHAALLVELGAEKRLPPGLHSEAIARASCVGIVGLPQQQAERARIERFTKDKRERLRYMMNGGALLRVLCDERRPKDATTFQEPRPAKPLRPQTPRPGEAPGQGS